MPNIMKLIIVWNRTVFPSLFVQVTSLYEFITLDIFLFSKNGVQCNVGFSRTAAVGLNNCLRNIIEGFTLHALCKLIRKFNCWWK